MSSLIHFRSKYKKILSGWENIDTFSGKSIEIRGIRNFNFDDDARNIAWKKSTSSERIFTKEHEAEGSTPVFFCTLEKNGWDFCTEKYPISKIDFTKSLLHSIKKSSEFFRFPLYILDIDGDRSNLEKIQPKKSIILVVSWALEEKSLSELTKYTKQNDVILLHLFHHFEIDPQDENTLLDSKKIQTEKYKETFWDMKQNVQIFLKKNGISVMDIVTDEDPTLALNFFFKHRYVR